MIYENKKTYKELATKYGEENIFCYWKLDIEKQVTRNNVSFIISYFEIGYAVSVKTHFVYFKLKDDIHTINFHNYTGGIFLYEDCYILDKPKTKYKWNYIASKAIIMKVAPTEFDNF